MSNVRSHPMGAVAVLMLAIFMTLLDLTILNIAIPSILDGRHASLDRVLWVLNAYSLLYALLLITSARLGNIYGPHHHGKGDLAVAAARYGYFLPPGDVESASKWQGPDRQLTLRSGSGVPRAMATRPGVGATARDA